jgi:hypothetical protein
MAAQPTPQQPQAPTRVSQPMAAQPTPQQPMAAQPTPRQTQAIGSRPSQSVVAQPTPRPSQPVAAQPDPNRPGSLPAIPRPGALPPIPQPNRATGDQPIVGAQPLGRPAPQGFAPSQVTRPNPIAAGSASQAKPATVETMSGPFAREPSTHVPPRRDKRDTDMEQSGVDVPLAPTPQPQQRVSRPIPAVPPVRPTPTPRPQQPRQPTNPSPTPQRPSEPAANRPPPGMTNDDVNALYAKYVKAKEMVGEATGPQTYGKLLNTINAQAPKIMEQYKAKGVDFSVVVKDNQVIIRAKPKP